MDATEALEELGFQQAAVWGQGRGLHRFTATRAVPAGSFVYAVTAEDRLLYVGTRNGGGTDLLDELSDPDGADEPVAIVHEAIREAVSQDYEVELYVAGVEDESGAEELREQVIESVEPELALE
jgi:hypothetical protein